MSENNEKEEKSKKADAKLAVTIELLLETLKQEKDEGVKATVEASLIRIADNKPEDLLCIFTDYKTNNPKIDVSVNACILRVMQFIVDSQIDSIDLKYIEKTIQITIAELVKYETLNEAIQCTAQDILVSIGKVHCDRVMPQLMEKFQEKTAPHYMVLNCMGTLATKNIEGIIQFIKPCTGALLPTLSGVRADHHKQAHAFVIGQFCEATVEYEANLEKKTGEECAKFNISSEIGVVYDVFTTSWMNARDPKLCSDILNALSHIFPLLQTDRVQEQALKIIQFIFKLYRRSIDRLSITQFLASVLKTCLKIDAELIKPVIDDLNASLFDLVCVTSNFELPQTAKGHYEVLRCFDLLCFDYGKEIIGLLLTQLRNNNQSERIKSVLVVTHLCSIAENIIITEKKEFLEILKQMIQFEKSLKMKIVLLKQIVAFTEKKLIEDVEFIRFILKHSCRTVKAPEHGTQEEYLDFIKTCNNSLSILCSTVGTIDNMLKSELLQVYVQLEYTDVITTIVRCLGYLFQKSAEIHMEETGDTESEEGVMLNGIPSSEAVFVRSLVLLGDFSNTHRMQYVLTFLKFYCTNVNKCLVPLWNEKIPELQVALSTKDETLFYGYLFQFIVLTIKDIDDPKFAEIVVNKMADQVALYMPVNQQLYEFRIPEMGKERGMLLRLMGLSLCHVTDATTIESKLDLIISTVKIEKLEKSQGNSDYESKFTNAAKAIGLISKGHFDIVRKKLENIIVDDAVKKSSSIFSGLNFMKDSSKEDYIYKLRILAIESWGFVVENAPQASVVKCSDSKIYEYMCRHLAESKDLFLKKMILKTLLNTVQLHLKSQIENQFKHKYALLELILKTPDMQINYEYLPIFPLILKLATHLIQIRLDAEQTDKESDHIGDLLQMVCLQFFTAAQTLRSKFDSQDEDERNSYIAKYLNQSLPELNQFIKITLELGATPARLDDIQTTLDPYLKDKNSEVRICACHCLNAALDVYMKTVKMGCEAPSKFNQTGSMLGKIIPRCIDSNATVRQTAVEILKRILEISCMYETLTIPDVDDVWIKELLQLKEDITTDDPQQIYRIAGDLAAIIANRLVNMQFVQFSKSLMYCIKDPEPSSGIGASIVLKFFVQLKGADMFHAIPDLIKEALFVIRYADNDKAKTGILKSLVGLAKHHPKLVSNEMLGQSLPYEDNVLEYWKLLSYDPELSGTILDNFISIMSSTCLYEPNETKEDKQRKAATVQPFAIVCALKEIFKSDRIKDVFKSRFAELFSMLLTTVANYTNLDAPIHVPKPITDAKSSLKKNKYGYIPNRELAKMIPCQVVLDAFKILLDNLEMEQISNVLTICPTLSSSTDLRNFIEILTPLAVGLVNQLNISSAEMKQLVTVLTKYVPSPYDGQRIAAIGLYSQLVSLKPCGDISSVIILHLSASLNDPTPLVRGLCILGLGNVGNLTQHDIEKYSETSLTALLKGIDDFNTDCLINIPLESMRGLSRILQTLPVNKLENFQVSLAIRIKPFFENHANDVREAAILLFGDLCVRTTFITNYTLSEAFKEQLIANLFTFILHLGECESLIVRACKLTLRAYTCLLDAPKTNELIQLHVSEYENLNYDMFIHDFLRVVGEELKDYVHTFIDACLPFLKTHWPEIRGTAAVVIGTLHHFNTNNQNSKYQTPEFLSQKIGYLLKDEDVKVKIKASEAIGYIYGDI